MEKSIKLPFYAKASLFFVGLFALVSMLYIVQGIIVPLIFSVMLAIVLHPVVHFLVRKKINRVVAISVALTFTLLILAGLGFFMFSQASRFGESWPKLVEKFTEILNQTLAWVSDYFDVSPEKIDAWFTKSKGELINTSGSAIGQTLLNVGSSLVVIFIMPVYIFMILFYEPLLLEFFRRIFGVSNRTAVSEIITKIKAVIQRYLTGLVIEAFLMAGMNTAALLILGIDFAILLGIIGALLNVIPYIGGLVAVALPMMIALATKASPWYAVYVLIVYYIIQLIDNNFIVPVIVASKVKINALVSIIVVLAFGSLWGVPGMFLSIPLVAIIKVICDHIESLKPIGFLLGDTMPALAIFNLKLPKEILKPLQKEK